MTIRSLVLDMDGVLWHGNTPLPGLEDLFGALTDLGLPFILATNNATNTVEQYVQKLGRFGVTVTPEQVLTSPVATVGHLKQHYPAGNDGLRRRRAWFTANADGRRVSADRPE